MAWTVAPIPGAEIKAEEQILPLRHVVKNHVYEGFTVRQDSGNSRIYVEAGKAIINGYQVVSDSDAEYNPIVPGTTKYIFVKLTVNASNEVNGAEVHEADTDDEIVDAVEVATITEAGGTVTLADTRQMTVFDLDPMGAFGVANIGGAVPANLSAYYGELDVRYSRTNHLHDGRYVQLGESNIPAYYASQAELDVHSNSDDHDSRYYLKTETYTRAEVVQVIADSSINEDNLAAYYTSAVTDLRYVRFQDTDDFAQIADSWVSGTVLTVPNSHTGDRKFRFTNANAISISQIVGSDAATDDFIHIWNFSGADITLVHATAGANIIEIDGGADAVIHAGCRAVLRRESNDRWRLDFVDYINLRADGRYYTKAQADDTYARLDAVPPVYVTRIQSEVAAASGTDLSAYYTKVEANSWFPLIRWAAGYTTLQGTVGNTTELTLITTTPQFLRLTSSVAITSISKIIGSTRAHDEAIYLLNDTGADITIVNDDSGDDDVADRIEIEGNSDLIVHDGCEIMIRRQVVNPANYWRVDIADIVNLRMDGRYYTKAQSDGKYALNTGNPPDSYIAHLNTLYAAIGSGGTWTLADHQTAIDAVFATDADLTTGLAGKSDTGHTHDIYALKTTVPPAYASASALAGKASTDHDATHRVGGTDELTGNLNAVARTDIRVGGTSVGMRRAIDLVEGDNVTLSGVDDSTNEKVTVTIAASGGSGGDGSGITQADADVRYVRAGSSHVPDYYASQAELDTGLAGKFPINWEPTDLTPPDGGLANTVNATHLFVRFTGNVDRNVDRIASPTAGRVLYLTAENAGRITVRHNEGSGNGKFYLKDSKDRVLETRTPLILVGRGSSWAEIFGPYLRADVAAETYALLAHTHSQYLTESALGPYDTRAVADGRYLGSGALSTYYNSAAIGDRFYADPEQATFITHADTTYTASSETWNLAGTMVETQFVAFTEGGNNNRRVNKITGSTLAEGKAMYVKNDRAGVLILEHTGTAVADCIQTSTGSDQSLLGGEVIKLVRVISGSISYWRFDQIELVNFRHDSRYASMGHNHNDLYFLKSETYNRTAMDARYVRLGEAGIPAYYASQAELDAVEAALNAHKAAGNTDHDGRYVQTSALSAYYTSAQVDTELAGKSDTTHNHDGVYATPAYVMQQVAAVQAGNVDLTGYMVNNWAFTDKASNAIVEADMFIRVTDAADALIASIPNPTSGRLLFLRRQNNNVRLKQAGGSDTTSGRFYLKDSADRVLDRRTPTVLLGTGNTWLELFGNYSREDHTHSEYRTEAQVTAAITAAAPDLSAYLTSADAASTYATQANADLMQTEIDENAAAIANKADRTHDHNDDYAPLASVPDIYASQAELDAHKTGSDHDNRYVRTTTLVADYYTSAQVDSAITTAVAGVQAGDADLSAYSTTVEANALYFPRMAVYKGVTAANVAHATNGVLEGDLFIQIDGNAAASIANIPHPVSGRMLYLRAQTAGVITIQHNENNSEGRFFLKDSRDRILETRTPLVLQGTGSTWREIFGPYMREDVADERYATAGHAHAALYAPLTSVPDIYASQAELDALQATVDGIDVSAYLTSATAASTYRTAEQVSAAITTAINSLNLAGTYRTEAQVSAAIQTAIDALNLATTYVTATNLSNNYYNKTESDGRFASKTAIPGAYDTHYEKRFMPIPDGEIGYTNRAGKSNIVATDRFVNITGTADVDVVNVASNGHILAMKGSNGAHVIHGNSANGGFVLKMGVRRRLDPKTPLILVKRDNKWHEVSGPAVSVMHLALGKPGDPLEAGDGQVVMPAPFKARLLHAKAFVAAASTSGIPTFQLSVGSTDLLSTRLTIDATEKTSVSAANAAVIGNNEVAADAILEVDVDVAGTGTKGAVLTLYWQEVA